MFHHQYIGCPQSNISSRFVCTAMPNFNVLNVIIFYKLLLNYSLKSVILSFSPVMKDQIHFEKSELFPRTILAWYNLKI
jgi:hypothetical protein